ncbi:MAG: 6-hydroxycyclohex-1-ene-1-carbonyl-CoA dehydrogenase [Deltaproteobacteria bacterium]|nr:6-hydroxycyclohex-1-ene-1-carbonyl-CoA dehydrogenase [Deltaproteobacteria bacterium]MBW1929566.1 6-hydroxycyclohex-1-ene-1-carbonyl-CoA dehydrogenase [Deltaproteobacteria bacterium]MBW2025077.1 6-hydroxycyclohex-1-ene-1-carbonyl-CoA dehydrogenase [Deltaproteobacteria bacterium]MBW2124987.1 6-hydroxycyclohex-1-ene-1-carbonyl-CoA dehydrogenase [Deltaproteobacteria bacterium]RLB14731.1 MAG: 6-hydroxycyclohex-1-ene-1-carbonyl-CoA dehydrogenase [Deltaproteobacteria bacterium]
MAAVPDKILTWQMVQPTTKDKESGKIIPGKIEKKELPVPELKPGEVLVEVAGCGVCHTDLGYFYDGVPTVSKPPLTLGHEISGTVVAGDEEWIGKEVLIPAVMPCRQCYLCKTRRGNRCLNQKMPGNSMGIYGGFSSHIPVPSIDLCEIKNRGDFPLEKLAVVADAATTPFQAAKRASLEPGDNVVVIGIGGVGQYMVQEAKALGASTVIAIDIVEDRLNKMLSYGADFVINSMGKSPKDVSNEIKAIRKQNGLPGYGWKIFEVTGTKPGQEIALSLLSFTGKLIVVGFGLQKVEYSISRLMAFDAEIIGTWACLPEYYPAVMDMVLSKKIQVEPFVQTRPMSTIVETFEEIHTKGSPEKRVVLVPDF